jgi:hypothetical protein
MKCSMPGQEKGDCLIVVTAWTGLPVYLISLTEFSMYVGDRLSHLPD